MYGPEILSFRGGQLVPFGSIILGDPLVDPSKPVMRTLEGEAPCRAVRAPARLAQIAGHAKRVCQRYQRVAHPVWIVCCFQQCERRLAVPGRGASADRLVVGDLRLQGAERQQLGVLLDGQRVVARDPAPAAATEP